MEGYLIAGLVGFILGVVAGGYASYWLANHLGVIRADVANLAGRIAGQQQAQAPGSQPAPPPKT